MPPVPKFLPKRPLWAKSGSPLEKLATMKSDKMDFATKVAPKPTPQAAEIDYSVEKKETARVDSREQSTKPVFGEAAEICALLRIDMLKDMDVCAKFVDAVKGVVGPSSFVKYTTEYMRTALLSMMQKTTILAAESLLLDQ
ncbi:hypothetical protein ACFX19_003232 [Malus domestica]